MRYKPDKTALIIDHVGNIFEHGFPQDDREWSLDGRKEEKKDNLADKAGFGNKVKSCPVCDVVLEIHIRTCPDCGHEFTMSKERPLVDVELEEITEDDLLRSKPYAHYKNCKTWDELNAFRKAKKYKQAWAINKAIELGIDIPNKLRSLDRHVRNRYNA
jgi:hypothetical protein